MAREAIPAGWSLARLSDLGEVNRGRSRHRPRYAEHLYGGPYPFIQTGDIKNSGGRITRYDQTYSEAGLAQSRMWPSGSMCITIAANIAETAILTFPACFPDSVVGFIPDESKCDVRFVEYTFRHLRHQIQHEASGSVQNNINLETLGRLRFPLPPLSEQRAIARILGTLDDKIELYRRMIETLEAMARAFFKSWFVDFDPVRARVEGRDPGLPKPIADLFPARLVDSELGEIPEGWCIEAHADHYDAVKGVSYKGSGLGNDGMPLHNLNSIHEGGGYKYDGIKYYSGEYAERHIVRPGDVIVANTEQGHDRLLIGYAAIIPTFFGERGIASHHIYRLRLKPGSPLTPSFLCSLLNSPQMHDLVSGYANGTTVNMLPVDGVQKPLIVCPPKELVRAFDSLAVTAQHRREEIVSESSTLAALRDTLLPRLISGELRVNYSDRFAAKSSIESADTLA